MSIIDVKNLTFSYFGSAKPVFDNVSFYFDTDWKTGLIGRNGIGKSTLFKLLLDEEEYTGSINKSVKMIKFPPDILDKSYTGLEMFNNISHEDWKLFRELNLLNLDESLAYRAINTLSNGERTKLLLAMLFTNDDGFLLIDEPTNHLDMEGRGIVSEYLRGKRGFLLVSHDRAFLDGCIDHVISINKNSIEVQAGNYSSWYENKTKKDSFELSKNEKLKKEIKRLKNSARRSKDWSDNIEKTKTGTRNSGVKPDKGYIGHQAARMMQRSKNIQKRQYKAIEEKQGLLKDIEYNESLKLHILPHHRETLISINNLSAYYDKTEVISDISFDINQGDRIALFGKNGSGKSTIIKILLGLHKDFVGNIDMASDLQISYVPQNTSELKGNLQDLINSHGVDETLCKTILRKLGFARELFDMDMSSYSEGQKKKTLIATSLAKPAHIFVWDEPLNYIDIISRIQIEDIINNSKPTLLFVEHDKKFVESIASKIIRL